MRYLRGMPNIFRREVSQPIGWSWGWLTMRRRGFWSFKHSKIYWWRLMSESMARRLLSLASWSAYFKIWKKERNSSVHLEGRLAVQDRRRIGGSLSKIAHTRMGPSNPTSAEQKEFLIQGSSINRFRDLKTLSDPHKFWTSFLKTFKVWISRNCCRGYSLRVSTQTIMRSKMKGSSTSPEIRCTVVEGNHSSTLRILMGLTHQR